jgi:hypothetical protein
MSACKEAFVKRYPTTATWAIFLLFLSVATLGAQDQPANDQPASVAGNWQISWAGRRGNEQGTLQLQQEGSKLSGTFQGPRGSSPLSGSVQGNNVSFSVQMQGRRSMTLAFNGAFDGSKMSGTFQPEGGGGSHGGHGGGGGETNHSWTATRQQGN